MKLDSKFTPFIRHGGEGALTIPWNPQLSYRTKAGGAPEAEIQALPAQANDDNIDFLLESLG